MLSVHLTLEQANLAFTLLSPHEALMYLSSWSNKQSNTPGGHLSLDMQFRRYTLGDTRRSSTLQAKRRKRFTYFHVSGSGKWEVGMTMIEMLLNDLIILGPESMATL